VRSAGIEGVHVQGAEGGMLFSGGFISEAARETPVCRETDVLVVGGGTAGVAAAIAAARNGARTLVVEAQGVLGGSQTAAFVTPMMRNHLKDQPLSMGLNEELLARYAQIDPPPTGSPSERLWHNPVGLAFALDDALADAGVDLLFHTLCVDVVKDGNAVRGVVTEGKSGRRAILCRVAVDCTGDADLAAVAGVPCQCGDEMGRNQPMSLRFAMAGVDLHRVAAFFHRLGLQVGLPLLSVGFHECHESPIADLVCRAESDGVLEPGDLGYFQFFAMVGRPGELSFNCPRLAGFRATDPEEISRAYLVGRRKVRRLAAFCRRYLPGFEGAYISALAPVMAVRESRRIEGEYVLTEEDVVSGRKFADAIARSNYPVDIHSPDGTGTTLRHLLPGEYHEIPYRCLVPVGVDGLLVAGRCVSATFAAQAAIRIQANCRAMGQAAGTAAAMAVRGGLEPRQVNGEELRAVLRQHGAAL